MGVGSKGLPSEPLIRYSLSVPGVHLVIIGIGSIDVSDDPEKDQLVANIAAAQIHEPLSSQRLREIEQMTAGAIGTDTNYFQRAALGLTPPRGLRADVDSSHIQHVCNMPAVYLTWETSYAGAAAISHYEVMRGEQKLGETPHRPQTTQRPFTFRDAEAEIGANVYLVRAVDRKDNKSEWAKTTVECPAAN